MARSSKIVEGIKERVSSGQVKEPFKVKDFPDLLTKSPAFLSKHCVENSDKYKPYFVRVGRGEYKLLVIDLI